MKINNKCGTNDRIIAFNKARNISKNFSIWTEYENLKEELTELVDATTDDDRIDALCDVIVFAVGAMWKLGYNPDVALDETLKEIESRKQDKQQEQEWFMNGANGKWQKSRSQVDMYKADYNRAKDLT